MKCIAIVTNLDSHPSISNLTRNVSVNIMKPRNRTNIMVVEKLDKMQNIIGETSTSQWNQRYPLFRNSHDRFLCATMKLQNKNIQRWIFNETFSIHWKSIQEMKQNFHIIHLRFVTKSSKSVFIKLIQYKNNYIRSSHNNYSFKKCAYVCIIYWKKKKKHSYRNDSKCP